MPLLLLLSLSFCNPFSGSGSLAFSVAAPLDVGVTNCVGAVALLADFVGVGSVDLLADFSDVGFGSVDLLGDFGSTCKTLDRTYFGLGLYRCNGVVRFSRRLFLYLF